jgi:pyruvate,water dikinase
VSLHPYWLGKIQPTDYGVVGYKAMMLNRLMEAGYEVIPGLSIGADEIQKVLAQLGEIDPTLVDFPDSSLRVDIRDYRALQSLAQRIRQGIFATTLPPAWRETLLDTAEKWQCPSLIFRASLAMPKQEQLTGLLFSHTYLGDGEGVEGGVKSILAELFQARSLFYWQKAGLEPKDLRLGLLVQPIWSAIASGKVEISEDTACIHATWGLGHAWVKGEVEPDRYTVQISTGEIQGQHLGHKLITYTIDPNTTPCLQRQPVSEDQFQTFALTPPFLRQLIQQVQQLAPLSRDAVVEWTLSSLNNDTPQIYLTQFTPLLSPHTTKLARSVLPAKPMTKPWLEGISGAPGEVVASAHLISGTIRHLQRIPTDKILVTRHLTPDWLPLIQKAAGVIAEDAGLTSHAAIIARELGIPAVVGVKDATRLITTGMTLRLDGTKGQIYRDEEVMSQPVPTPPLQEKALPQTESQSEQSEIVLGTSLFVNLSQPDSIPKAAQLKVDGVGLLRSELMLLRLWQERSPQDWLHPNHREQLVERIAQLITQFTTAFAPRPVFYRAVDWRYSDFAALTPQSKPEGNPLIGQRGTFAYQENPALFEAELAALKRVIANGNHNLRLILPFVRSVAEFVWCRDRAHHFRLTQSPNFQLWIMAEVPSVLWLLPQYQQAGVQGIAIGTNDLTQLLLGFDAQQPAFGNQGHEEHPAVLGFLQQLIGQAHQLQLPCTICGEAPQKSPHLLRQLIRWGINGVSVAPEAVLGVRGAIAQAEKQLLLDAARTQLNSSNHTEL